jgi:uncharacterized membrane protein
MIIFNKLKSNSILVNMPKFRGQALMTLIFFTIFGVTITTAAVMVIMVNSLSAARLQDGSVAYQIAQSGADNALIRLIRDPSYTGETLTVGDGSAIITVTGTGTLADPYIVISTGDIRSSVKKIEIHATYINNRMTIVSQKELF